MNLSTLLANKHTSTAALVFFLLGVVTIIWPESKPKVDQIKELALIYGLLSAGDGKPKEQNEKTPPPTGN